jgi:hypothetical protein
MIFKKKQVKPSRIQDDSDLDMAVDSMVPQTVSPSNRIVQKAPSSQMKAPAGSYFSASANPLDRGNLKVETPSAPQMPTERNPNIRRYESKAALDAAKRQKEQSRASEQTPDLEDLYSQAIRDLLQSDLGSARGALSDELKAQNAEALATQDARMGLAGAGLSGAAGAARMSEARKNARNEVLTMNEFDRAEKQDRLAAIQAGIAGKNAENEQIAFDAALKQAEIELGEDLNGDGRVEKDKAASEDEIKDYIDGLAESTWDYSWFDKNTGPGTKEEPYNVSSGERDEMEAMGFEFTPVEQQTGPFTSVTLYKDQYGNYYFFNESSAAY